MGLKAYLKAEGKALQDSNSRFDVEFGLFCELADLYEEFTQLIKLSQNKLTIPAKLYLVVQCQMYGVVSQLLRRRITDADGLTRRAIEATATAHRLWKNHQLSDVFENAFPYVDQIGHPKQWHRSKDYDREFKTGELFPKVGKNWNHLKALYAMFSAMSSHTGPGATVTHEIRDGALSLQFLEADNRSVRFSWNYLLDAYWEMLHLFVLILGTLTDADSIKKYEKKIVTWIQKAAVALKNRQPAGGETIP